MEQNTNTEISTLFGTMIAEQSRNIDVDSNWHNDRRIES